MSIVTASRHSGDVTVFNDAKCQVAYHVDCLCDVVVVLEEVSVQCSIQIIVCCRTSEQQQLVC